MITKTKENIIASYYTCHYEELKNYVGSRLQYSAETEDLVQNVFVRLLQMKQMITPVTLPSLTYTIAHNLISDYWRHKKKTEEYEHFIKKSNTVGKHAIDGESVYSTIEIEELLEHGIAQLNKKERIVYRMNLFDGLKVSEIAQKTDSSYKSTENHLGRARKVVRNYIMKMLA